MKMFTESTPKFYSTLIRIRGFDGNAAGEIIDGELLIVQQAAAD